MVAVVTSSLGFSSVAAKAAGFSKLFFIIFLVQLALPRFRKLIASTHEDNMSSTGRLVSDNGNSRSR
jgi:uncharacterized membrane protein YtjA (UPF0391 family)